ncbi:hypothetical protein QC761_405170 [Podospora bellae-mahoneyi]|nr:hypothetical protein QC761_405170 [Podospora bellae-mahoneyi]
MGKGYTVNKNPKHRHLGQPATQNSNNIIIGSSTKEKSGRALQASACPQQPASTIKASSAVWLSTPITILPRPTRQTHCRRDPYRTAYLTPLPNKMCYFEQTRWNCGYWKWGTFRQQCEKEYRTGETCGLKLVYSWQPAQGPCKICEQKCKKERRIDKMLNDIQRWQREGNRRATIEKTMRDVNDIQLQINELLASHVERERTL